MDQTRKEINTKYRQVKSNRHLQVKRPDEITFGDEYRFYNEFHVNRERSHARLIVTGSAIERHDCDRRCVTFARFNLDKVSNPFTVPFMYNFRRVALKHGHDGVKICFVTPCGKVLAHPLHVLRYLATVQLKLDIDHFTFSPNFVLSSIRLSRDCATHDITEAQETKPISCVDTLEMMKDFKPDFRYIRDRRAHEEIREMDKEEFEQFRTCCSCTDDCADVDTCECRQLTREVNCGENSGYQYKRLDTCHEFGIYECNGDCACSVHCLNRVVQNGIKVRVQVFASHHMDWALRALHFIPQGAFVAAYNAELINQELFKRAQDTIDEQYLADMDYIEVARRAADGDNPPREKLFADSRTKMLSVDATKGSNVGRFFNHSCNPNLFVQNVFIETHDIRYNHLALFASRDIAPFEELTWDYNYEVGTDDDRRLDCKCEANNCRLKLL